MIRVVALLVLFVFVSTWSPSSKASAFEAGVDKSCTPIGIAAGRAMEGRQYDLSETLTISLALRKLHDNWEYTEPSPEQRRGDQNQVFDVIYRLQNVPVADSKAEKTALSAWTSLRAYADCVKPGPSLPRYYKDLTEAQKACVKLGIVSQRTMLMLQSNGKRRAQSYLRRTTPRPRIFSRALDYPKKKTWTGIVFVSYWFAYHEGYRCLTEL